MTRTRRVSIVAAFAFVLAFAAGLALAGSYDAWLTAADVQKTAGLPGIKSIPANPSIGAGGDLNFATADGQVVLMVQVVGADNYAKFVKMYSKGPVSGIGKEAIKGATVPGQGPNFIAFTKGAHCVTLTVFADWENGGALYMPFDKLEALAKLVASRMP